MRRGNFTEALRWLLLTADGTIPARIVYGHPPRHAQEPYRISEVDLSAPEFPEIRSRVFEPHPEDHAVPDLSAACEALGIVGTDAGFVKALHIAARVARYDAHVLLLGETGTGKEYFAKLIHTLSGRPSDRFVVANCAAFPKELVESMLFGHRKGAFTGAAHDMKGEFDNADDGTLFLDEIAELPLASQSKLLRVLQDGSIKPLGADRPHTVNVRVVAATNVDMTSAIKARAFRLDLAKRFGVSISVPPLRKRRGDIIKLATYALENWNRKHGERRSISREALALLQRHPWPGNVRELVSVVETAAMLSAGRVIQPADLSFDDMECPAPADASLPVPAEGFSLKSYMEEVRAKLMRRALDTAGGNCAGASRLLGVSPQAVHKFARSQPGTDKDG